MLVVQWQLQCACAAVVWLGTLSALDAPCKIDSPLASTDIRAHDLRHSQQPNATACARECCSEPQCGGYTFADPVGWSSSECPRGSRCCFLKDHTVQHADLTREANVSSAVRPGTPDTENGGGPCGSDFDCSGGGECVDGKCRCDATFTGQHCLKLNLLPLDTGADVGFPSDEGVKAQRALPTNSTFPWGGALVEDDAGLYHLFFTEWLDHCPMRYDTFATSTHIAHATSPSITGPWARRGIAVPPAAGNPAMTRAPDGTGLLYYTNHRYTGRVQNCTGPTNSWGAPVLMKNSSTKCHSGQHVSMGISLAHSESLDGPWEYEEDIISVPASNPGGPIFFDNGSLILPFQTWPPGAPCTSPSCITIVTAAHWKAWPYNSYPLGQPGTKGHCVEQQDVRNPGSVEDPSNIWRDARGTLHVLMHEAHFGSRAWSTDQGHTWAYNYSNEAYPYAAGSISCADGREEPRVLLNPETRQPVALSTLCKKGGGPLPGTYFTRVLIQRINDTHETNTYRRSSANAALDI